jgi:hypothetical protein
MPLFDAPVKFEEAVRSRKSRALLRTELTHEELSRIRPEIREMATWSARVTNARIVERIDKVIKEVIEPTKWEDGATKGINLGEAKARLRDALKEVGYTPEQPGTIMDLTSDARTELIVKTNTQMAWGYGQWEEAQDPDTIDLFPAWELFRLEEREEPRDWDQIWREAASESDPRILGAFEESGRMVALKNSLIWFKISDFGLPYPPFKFNSGMWTQEVDFDDAMSLGILSHGEKVNAQERRFGEGFEISMQDLPAETQAAVVEDLEKFGGRYAFEDGVLRRTG